jgi:hypothetical protein
MSDDRPSFSDALLDLINEYLTPEEAEQIVDDLRREASVIEFQLEEDE